MPSQPAEATCAEAELSRSLTVWQAALTQTFRRTAYLAFALAAAALLSGCMEALRGSPASGPVAGSPPAARTGTGVVISPTAASTQAPAPSTAGAPTAPVPAELPTPAEPDTPTAAVVEPAPSAVPTVPGPLPTLALPALPTLSNEERWRARQIGREVFPGLQTYTTQGSELWWYDPLNQQSVPLGRFAGEFSAQARFTLSGEGLEALEVPYQVNLSYGLTALSPAVIERIQAAGYSDWVETYVILTASVVSR